MLRTSVSGRESTQRQVFVIELLWNIYSLFFQETEKLVCLNDKGLSKSSPALTDVPPSRLT